MEASTTSSTPAAPSRRAVSGTEVREPAHGRVGRVLPGHAQARADQALGVHLLHGRRGLGRQVVGAAQGLGHHLRVPRVPVQRLQRHLH